MFRSLVRTKKRLAAYAFVAVLILSGLGFQAFTSDTQAAPGGATERVIERDASGSVRITYFDQTAHTPVSGTTPVAGTTWCAPSGEVFTKFVAQVTLQGTMTGTNPTVSVTWEHSYDHGANWIAVGSWTTINSTVTPASQVQTVSDVVGSTAVAYGDCWRAKLTFGGTSPGANISIVGYAKP